MKIKTQEKISLAEEMMQKLKHASIYLEGYAIFIDDPDDNIKNIKQDLFKISENLDLIYQKIKEFTGTNI